MTPARRRLIAAGLSLAWLWTSVTPALATTIDPLPCGLQVSLLSKVLSFDRTLSGKREPIDVFIIYQADYPLSAASKDELMHAARQLGKAGGLQLRFRAIALEGKPDFRTVFTAVEADVAYIMPLRGLNVERLARAAAAANVRTFSGLPDYVYEGISVTVGEKSGRPAIYVNLAAARAQGSDYSSQLLKLANVIE